MKDYLRNQFLMYGIVSPQRKEVQKRIFPAIKELKGTAEGWQFIHSLLSKDEREFFYFALDWLNSWNEKLLLESDIVEIETMNSSFKKLKLKGLSKKRSDKINKLIYGIN